MYAGKLVFAQVMDHLPWHRFHRLVEQYKGNREVQSFSCSDQYRCMAFAQLTCLRAQAGKLYHMASAAAWRETRFPTPTASGTEGSTPRSRNTSSTRRGACIMRKATAWISTTRSTRSIPPPSTCACPSFPGRGSGRPRRPSSCTRSLTCAATSPHSFTSPKAGSTTSTSSTSWPRSRKPCYNRSHQMRTIHSNLKSCRS